MLFRATIEEIALAQGYEYAKQSVFEYLIERFKAEADDWSGFVTDLATELNGKAAGMPAKPVSTSAIPATVEEDADAIMQRAFAMLHSHDTRRAIQGCSDLVALFPGSFAFLEEALADRGLENRHDDILFAVAKLGETALPLMESIVACLFSPTANVAVRVYGGQALAGLGRDGCPRILEFLKSLEQYDWATIRDHVLRQLETSVLAAIGTEPACHAVYQIYCRNAPDNDDEDDSQLRKLAGRWLRSWGMLPDNSAAEECDQKRGDS